MLLYISVEILKDSIYNLIFKPMNATKALSQLGFVTARGLDNGEYGALLLSNKVNFKIM